MIRTKRGPRSYRPHSFTPPEEIQRRFLAEALNEEVEEEDDIQDWQKVGMDPDRPVDENQREDARKLVRQLAKQHPYVKRALGLYEDYVVGSGSLVQTIRKNHSNKETKADQRVMRDADEAWEEFLFHNRKWWTMLEYLRRYMRDGETFTLKEQGQWPPTVKFIDPEEIDEPGEDSKGIRTDPRDNTRVLRYVRIDRMDRTVITTYDPEQIWHTKIDVDSTQKRGVTRFYSIRWSARKFRHLMNVEVAHRTLQSSIVMQRKVKGSPTRLSSVLDNAKTSTKDYADGSTVKQEKLRSGSIITTNEGVELEFAHPDNNFSDASPLAKLLLQHIGSATGFPYYMIASDSGDNNFASTLVQESPVVLMIQKERSGFKGELLPIWLWVMERAIAAGKIGNLKSMDSFLKKYKPEFKFPPLVTRDRLKEAQADNIHVMNGAISVPEASRRADADPERMLLETLDYNAELAKNGLQANMGAMNTQPNTQDPDNNTGQNQGDEGEPNDPDPRKLS